MLKVLKNCKRNIHSIFKSINSDKKAINHPLIKRGNIFSKVKNVSVLPVGSAFASRSIHRLPQLSNLVIAYLLHIYR